MGKKEISDSSLALQSKPFPGRSAHLTLIDSAKDHAPMLGIPKEDSEKLLSVIARSLEIKRHYELFLLMQGEVQHFIPHQILIAAWGDFSTSNLTFDVLSDIAGVRTQLAKDCGVNDLLKDLFTRWLANGRRPLLLSNSVNERLSNSPCSCALHKAMHGMWSILVHGAHDARTGDVSLYVAMNPSSMLIDKTREQFSVLVDMLIAQIDLAFQRVTALTTQNNLNDSPKNSEELSMREMEIMRLVAAGKTNCEIALSLSISRHTVNNHVQRIFKKLRVCNRTKAVAIIAQRSATPGARKEDS